MFISKTDRGTFAGLGLSPPSFSYNLFDNTPDSSQWVFSIGSPQYWPSSGLVQGPHPAVSAVKKVQLSVLYTQVAEDLKVKTVPSNYKLCLPGQDNVSILYTKTKAKKKYCISIKGYAQLHIIYIHGKSIN